jgi:hypothetical protein
MTSVARMRTLLNRPAEYPFTWDDRMYAMQQLGEVYLYMETAFDWRVRHDSVTIIDGEDHLTPEGQGTNPYAAAENHWHQLTRPGVLVYAWAPRRVVMWEGFQWMDLPELLLVPST